MARAAHPRFDLLIPDVNGIWRGLSAPLEESERLLRDPLTWSSSLFSSRFDGSVVEETGHGIRAGDPDFILRAVSGSEAAVPWYGGGGGKQAVYAMYRPSGEPYELDPQHVLQGVLARLAADGLDSVLATEFEFYLTERDSGEADGKSGFSDLYSVDEIERQAPFFDLINDYAAVQGLELGNIVSEYGAGQWEINLAHKAAARAVLDGLLLRRLVRACAGLCGKRATFLAKPYGDASGNGMHIHLSLWKDGRNCFSDERVLLQAVAGILAVIPQAMAFFAPYDNSYRRFLPDSYAPCEASWGRENRAVAVRLPLSADESGRRLEFRLSGADVNPILVAAALLAGAHWGIREGLTPPPEQTSGAVSGNAPVPLTWRAALDELSQADILPHYFSGQFLSNYRCIKENEWRHHRRHVSDYDRDFYGRVI